MTDELVDLVWTETSKIGSVSIPGDERKTERRNSLLEHCTKCLAVCGLF